MKIIAASLLLICTVVGFVIFPKDKPQPGKLLANPEYLHGKILDLPEELSVAGDKDNLGVTVKGDTIFVYFKN